MSLSIAVAMVLVALLSGVALAADKLGDPRE
jgi:hypothetical protein